MTTRTMEREAQYEPAPGPRPLAKRAGKVGEWEEAKRKPGSVWPRFARPVLTPHAPDGADASLGVPEKVTG